jgi:hypothetical protein
VTGEQGELGKRGVLRALTRRALCELIYGMEG